MVEPGSTVMTYTPSMSVVTALRLLEVDYPCSYKRLAVVGRRHDTRHPQTLGKSRQREQKQK